MQQKTTVLAIFANPKGSDPLRLSSEDRIIHECIRLSKNREKITIEVRHSATIHDLRRALLEKEYEIIHFSGHGTGKGLAFENEVGDVQVVPPEALADFLSKYPHIKCIILNACYSDLQGSLLKMSVPYIIAMNGPISDQAAIEFTRGFYDAVGAGKNIEFAYKEGCDTINLSGLQDVDVPILLKRETGEMEDGTNMDDEQPAILNPLGRENEIQQIMNAFRDPHGKPFISISGLGGIGKTTLASAVAAKSQQDGMFEQVIWETSQQEMFSAGKILASTPSYSSLETLLENILTKLGSKDHAGGRKNDDREDADQKIKRTMALLADRRILVVIDNLETAIQYKTIVSRLEAAVPANFLSRFIFTSRPKLDEFAEVHCLSLTGLSEKECINFLRQEGRARGIATVIKADEKHLRTVAQSIGGAPLAGKLLVAQLGRLPIEIVLENLKDAKGDMELIYAYIYRKTWELLSPGSRKVLLCMPVFPKSVTRATIEYVSTVKDSDLNNAISELVSMSLLNSSDDITAAKRRYGIHQLTRNFVQTELIEKWA